MKEENMIQNSYLVTWKRFREWGFENAIKGVRLGISIMWLLLAVFILSFGNQLAIAYVFFAFCLYRALFRWLVVTNTQYRHLCTNHKGADWERNIFFEETKIILNDGIITVEYLYSDINRIKEKENKVWLYMKNKTVVRLYKDCFTTGNWEMCKTLLDEKRIHQKL